MAGVYRIKLDMLVVAKDSKAALDTVRLSSRKRVKVQGWEQTTIRECDGWVNPAWRVTEGRRRHHRRAQAEAAAEAVRPIAPRTGAPEVTVAEEQEEYMPVTVGLYRFLDTGMYGRLLRFTFTPEERAALARGEDIYFMQLYGEPEQPMTPIAAQVGPGEWKVE